MKILLTGDYFYNYENEHEDILTIKSFLAKYDASVINWEGSFSGHNKRKINKSVNLEFSAAGSKLPSNSILCLSNNHILDYGKQGLERTLKTIEQNNYRWFGIQSHSGSIDNFQIINIGELRICFIGFGWKNEECRSPTKDSPGIANITKKNIDKIFGEINNHKYDFIISYIHAGYEYEYYPLPLHVELSRYLIDMGSDIVYQSHTHCIQPYEIYNDKYIFYGLGNFYFSSLRDKYPEISDAGIMIEMDIQADLNYKIDVFDIVYDRKNKISSVNPLSHYLEDNEFSYHELGTYSRNYQRIRTRKKNPRPIMHQNSPISNEIKYILWLAIVKITGILKIRKIVKIFLGWQ